MINLAEHVLLGIAILSFVGSSIVPMPMIPLEALTALGFYMKVNTMALFIVVVLASSLGGYTTYIVGTMGSRLLNIFNPKRVEATKEHLKKWGVLYVAVSSLAFVIPYDLVALCCGILRMDKHKFFIATVLGKIVRTLIVLAILTWGKV